MVRAMSRMARIVGLVAGVALTVSFAALGLARWRLAARDGAAAARMRVALEYWRSGCIPPEYVRAEDVDESVREFRERLDMPVSVEMRPEPHPDARRIVAEICLGRAGNVVTLEEEYVDDELEAKAIMQFERIVSAWRFRAGPDRCYRDRFSLRQGVTGE
jgi:hypothetical protein